jgi:hypothetical protein
MEIVGSFCILMLVATTVIHDEVLRMLKAGLPLLGVRPRLQLILVIIGAFCAHAIEIVLYAVAFYYLATWFGEGSMGETGPLKFARCLYFSAETYTSLGYGDVVPHGDLRMLAGMEAINGLLLIGWTTSFTYMSMQRFWERK